MAEQFKILNDSQSFSAPMDSHYVTPHSYIHAGFPVVSWEIAECSSLAYLI